MSARFNFLCDWIVVAGGPPAKPWERAGTSSGPTPFKPPSSGSTSDVVEASGTARPGEIVSTADRNTAVNRNNLTRPVPTRPWEQQQNYGSTYGGGKLRSILILKMWYDIYEVWLQRINPPYFLSLATLDQPATSQTVPEAWYLHPANVLQMCIGPLVCTSHQSPACKQGTHTPLLSTKLK